MHKNVLSAILLSTISALGVLQRPVTAQARQFYLTSATTHGASAPFLCASGYHLASIWEILDPTTLRYNTTLGLTRADSGSGPPTGFPGWVRTGFDAFSTTGNPAGSVNCLGYTSTAGNGTTAQLPVTTWSSTGSRIAPWEVFSPPCNSNQRAWCVQN